MKRRIMALLMVAALSVVVALPAQAATASDFSGIWVSTDIVDDSNQLMIITPGLGVLLFDDSATACGGPPAIVVGRGTIDGDSLDVNFRLRCVGGGGFSGTISFNLNENGTLTDDTGTVWTRVFP